MHTCEHSEQEIYKIRKHKTSINYWLPLTAFFMCQWCFPKDMHFKYLMFFMLYVIFYGLCVSFKAHLCSVIYSVSAKWIQFISLIVNNFFLAELEEYLTCNLHIISGSLLYTYRRYVYYTYSIRIYFRFQSFD